jgi:pimeloyl-ACP methyl ester carboxylesterase
LAALTLIIMLGFGYLWFNSPGEAQPILAADGSVQPNSVSSIETFEIGGVPQSVIVRGRSADAPVLLVVHGGPGTPAYPFFRARNAGLEDDFVVAYWEQRGAGLSFDPDANPADLTIDQMIADTAQLAAALADQFGQERVFLLGHSWGGALAILTARDHPELFHRVFAVSPVIAQYEAEQGAHAWLIERAKASGDDAEVSALSDLTVPARDASGADWVAYLGPQRSWLEPSGAGTTHDPISVLQLAGMLAKTPEYTVADKWRYLKGSRGSMQQLWPQIVAMDLREDVTTLDVPLILIHGVHDRVTTVEITRSFMESLTATDVKFHSFEDSAHSALLEEPDTFNAIVRAEISQ